MSVKITSTGGISALGGLSSTQVNNYFASNVGIGINRPAYALTIDNGDLLVCTDNGGYFQVDESADAVKHSDCVKAMFGTGNDLQIYHDCDNSYIAQGGTGSLYISHNQNNADIYLQASAGSGTAVDYVILDSSQCAIRMKRKTKWDDNICATFGNGEDLQIYHSDTGEHSYIDNSTGDLFIRNNGENDVVIGHNANKGLVYVPDGRVELRFNDSKKFETTDDGIKATGAICGTGNLDIDGHSTLMGNLSVRGTVTCIDTRIETTSAIEVQNAGTGPAILANQLGSQPVVDFQDDGTSAFYIEDGGNVGIGTTNPGAALQVQDGQVRAGHTLTCGYSFHDMPTWGYTASTSPTRLALVTDGVERMSLLHNGSFVGIGETNPGEALTVAGNISACGGLSATKMDNYFACKVGIGCNKPTFGKLHVKQHANTSSGGIAVVNTGGGRSLRLWNNSSNVARIDGGGDGSGDISINGAGCGNVAIGGSTAGVDEKLTVHGNLSALGHICTTCCNVQGKIVRGTSCVVASKVDAQFISNVGEVCLTSGCHGCIRLGSFLGTKGVVISANNANEAKVSIGVGSQIGFSDNDAALTVNGNISAYGGLSATNGNNYFAGGSTGFGVQRPTAGTVTFADNCSIRMGNDGDMRMYHNGTNNFFESHNGDIVVYNYDHGNDIIFCAENSSGTAGNYIHIDSSANCTIFDKNVRFSDNVNAYFGTGGDLQIVNDSADSIIRENSRHLCIQNAATDGDIIFTADCGDGSATTPYFAVDGGFGGICYFKSTLHADGVQAGFGTGNDMQIQHNGANGFINNACGILNICSADDVVIDAESDINLDANGADIRFKDDGTIIGAFQNSGSNFVIKSGQDDNDIIFCGSDGGSDITALTLDMSDAGKALFNNAACMKQLCIVDGSPVLILQDNSDDDDHHIQFINSSGTVDYEIRTQDPTSGGGGDGLYIGSCQSDGEVVLFTNDTHALTLAANQRATFADEVCMGDGKLVLNGTAVTACAAELNLLDGCSSLPSGTITGVTAGTNLNGGGSSGSVTVNLDGNVTGLTCLTVDDITVNGSLISNAGCGHLCVCGGGDIALDSSNGDIKLRDAGTDYGRFLDTSNNFIIQSLGDDKDLIFCGCDGGSPIKALCLDMSDAGSAHFNHNISLPSAGEIDFDSGDVKFVHASNALTLQGATNGLKITGDGSNATALVESGAGEFKIDSVADITLDAGGGDIILSDDTTIFGTFSKSGNDLQLRSRIADGDVFIRGVDGASTIDAAQFDMSDAGTAIFNNKVCMGDGKLVLNGSAVNSTATELNLLDGCTSACGIDCTGTTTASNSQTFTNKGGNISQWTNDCGYLTSESCCGTVTCIATGDGIDGGPITSSGTICVDCTVIRNSGDNTITGSLTVDDITINASNISDSGTLYIEAGGDIILEADGGDICLLDDSTEFGRLRNNSSNFVVESKISNQNLIFCGNDGGVQTTALTLDMSDAGTACFNHDVKLEDDGILRLGTHNDLQLSHDGTNGNILYCGPNNLQISGGSCILIGYNNSGTYDETAMTMQENGAVTIRHDNSTKFTTTADGVCICGDLDLGDSKLVLNNTAVTSTATELNLLDGCTSACGIDCTGTTTASNSQTFTNKGGNISQWTNDCGYTTCTGTTTPSNSQTFTNKGGNISQWTNDCCYTTCEGTVTCVATGDGLTGGAVTSSGTLCVDCTVIRTTGDQSIAGTKTITGQIDFEDDVTANFGDSQDLSIYHNGTSSFIDNDKNHICIRNNVDGDDGGNIYLMPHDNENGIIINDDSTVVLYNNNSVKFCTCSSGSRTTGTHCASTCLRAPTVCGTTCVRGATVCGTTAVCGSLACFSCAGIGTSAGCSACLTVGGSAGCCGCGGTPSILACYGVNICGTLSKASGCFDIVHPLPELSASKRLSHSFVEAPQADNIYSGVVELTAGKATVNIDNKHGMTSGTLTALNRCFRTFTTNETNWDPVRGSVSGNLLTVESCVADSTATVSWMVLGERHDPHMYDNPTTDEDGRVRVEYNISDDTSE